MYVDEFENILKEFSQAFEQIKPLCKKIRSILFPLLEDGALFTGTPSDSPKKLYDLVIEAFDNVIVDMEDTE